MGFDPNPPVSIVCCSTVRLAGRYCVMMAKMTRLVQLSRVVKNIGKLFCKFNGSQHTTTVNSLENEGFYRPCKREPLTTIREEPNTKQTRVTEQDSQSCFSFLFTF